MKVRWTTPAKTDLASIVRYIRNDKSLAAIRVRNIIATEVASLSDLSLRGRKGELEGTYELVFAGWPYIAVYRVLGDEIQILRVRHSSMLWP